MSYFILSSDQQNLDPRWRRYTEYRYRYSNVLVVFLYKTLSFFTLSFFTLSSDQQNLDQNMQNTGTGTVFSKLCWYRYRYLNKALSVS